MERPVASFDVDGTLYRSNLLVDLVHQLVRQGSLPTQAVDEFSSAQLKWKVERHRESYVQYMNRLIETYVRYLSSLSVKEVNNAAIQVMRYSPGLVYVYGRNLVRSLKGTHQLVAISGSPVEIVAPFVRRLGINEVHATTFESARGVYTGEIIHIGTHKKDETLGQMVKRMGLSFRGSVAVGDTDSDISMLDLVERLVAFNPNKELFEHAFQKGWEIVYEHKDMILHLGGGGQFSIENNFGHFRQK